ncbi:MAG: HAD family hydrolase [Planctomycetes bacterium]|nr:HAD family hydrolase [Planctomycetota bacterium]
MGEKCVFLDRDGTIIEDPGYLTEPEAVKLLPGVDAALRSLADAGYKLVIVTNQSAIARGLITEEGLERIHNELRRQLSERGVNLDGIYYCPYHPEGTIEKYARISADQKPSPGMLLRAAKDLDIDLNQSWMVGDSPRDIEAGQRAGCRTIRIRRKPEAGTVDDEDEDVQADYTVRNLVDAAKVIIRESQISSAVVSPTATSGRSFTPPVKSTATTTESVDQMSDSQVLREILRVLRRMTNHDREAEFSGTRLVGAIFQIFALIALLLGLIYIPGATSGDANQAYNNQIVVHIALLAAAALQLAALTFFILSRQK